MQSDSREIDFGPVIILLLHAGIVLIFLIYSAVGISLKDLWRVKISPSAPGGERAAPKQLLRFAGAFGPSRVQRGTQLFPSIRPWELTLLIGDAAEHAVTKPPPRVNQRSSRA